MSEKKYTPDTVDLICKYVAEGLFQKDAAVLAGVNPSTLSEWKSQYPELAKALKAAELSGKKEMLDSIRKASKKTWQSAAWYLERKHHDEWGLKNQHKVEGELTITLTTPRPTNEEGN